METLRLGFTPDGTPYSGQYDDIYYSCHGGPEQARHVFLRGNQLPERWQGRGRFVILETGFGLGLNFLITWAAWKNDPRPPQQLHFVSVEKYPLSLADLAKAHALWAQFPELAQPAAKLREQWPLPTPGMHRLFFEGGKIVLTLVFGDAARELRRLMLSADAFYLDGFSPDKNPDMWSPNIIRALARLAAPKATLATWSVAGGLREALAENGFTWEKQPGFAGKRHMLTGAYYSEKPQLYPEIPAPQKKAIIIGAGVAGTSAAAALSMRGWQIEILERANEPGQGASGNLAGVMRPLPSVDDNFLARLTRAGFFAALRHLKMLDALESPARWGQTGAFHIARDKAHEIRQEKAALQFPPEFLQYLDQNAAKNLLKHNPSHGGWYFPEGGWVQPPSLCRANIAAWPLQITARFACPVASIQRNADKWQALDKEGKILAEAPHLIIAGGIHAPSFAPLNWLPQKSARGQVSWLKAETLPALDLMVCGQGYITPPIDGIRVIGASYQLDDGNEMENPKDHLENLHKLEQLLPGFAPSLNAETLRGRVGFRPISPDRLPIVGAVPDPSSPCRRHMPVYPNLWCLQGFGSRGIVWSALMADFLASRINGEPLPLEYDLVRAIAPERFLIRGKNT